MRVFRDSEILEIRIKLSAVVLLLFLCLFCFYFVSILYMKMGIEWLVLCYDYDRLV